MLCWHCLLRCWAFQRKQGGHRAAQPCPISISVVPIYAGMYVLREKLGRYFKCVSLLRSCLRHIPCMYATPICLFGVLYWTMHIIAISWPFPGLILSFLSAVFAAFSEDCILLSVLWLTAGSLQSLSLGLPKLAVLVHYLYCSRTGRPLCAEQRLWLVTHTAVCPKVRDALSQPCPCLSSARCSQPSLKLNMFHLASSWESYLLWGKKCIIKPKAKMQALLGDGVDYSQNVIPELPCLPSVGHMLVIDNAQCGSLL